MTEEKKGFFDEEITKNLQDVDNVGVITDILTHIERIQQSVTQFDKIIYIQNQRIEQLHGLVSLIVSRDPELTKIITEYGEKQGIKVHEQEDK